MHFLIQLPPTFYVLFVTLPFSHLLSVVLFLLGLFFFNALYVVVLIERPGVFKEYRNARLLVTYIVIATAILLLITCALWLAAVVCKSSGAL
ncbi:hypothetical protein BGP77_17330 [Saccharospirillum sp. MSK14-1]|uniref:hypothetical protein n=1 Tax=Saccharospirillum sp. MSK14-1 TaxID=1897632 RepID=UPI000D389C7D|nr:hypothetical protein [Saccharospirillum sp. MSK14-1]PTY38206.1 hypothetical protein BGP77_17330 [Saccharospirillum sp. MSK14-1]